MSAHRLPDYIAHMLEATQLACSYIDGLSKDEFLADKRTQQAVILNVIIIGEVATKIINNYPEFTEQHTSVPWKNMKGMRNRIAHGYFDINLDIVWGTVRDSLPTLANQLITIQKNMTE
ncbi:MAG TPA: DUF86 domain-containing protein [Gammaproteobacteria bacterium]|nr:DUF86 domain-containing protein [Gammaproteobacteria bacterium]